MFRVARPEMKTVAEKMPRHRFLYSENENVIYYTSKKTVYKILVIEHSCTCQWYCKWKICAHIFRAFKL